MGDSRGAARPYIGWGVDSFGGKHYLCNYCELYFGEVDPATISHKCDTSKKRYYNRGVIARVRRSASK